jgi:hypothetical protein
VLTEWYRLSRPGRHTLHAHFEPIPENVTSALEVLAQYPELAGRLSRWGRSDEETLRHTGSLTFRLDVSNRINAIPDDEETAYSAEEGDEAVYSIRPSVVSRRELPPAELMTWWLILYGLSMFARYHPREWVKALDVDSSEAAVLLDRCMSEAMDRVPYLVLDAIRRCPSILGWGVIEAAIEKLYTFVDAERRRFDDMQNNVFAMSMAHIGRYAEFLAIIVDRYESANRAYMVNTEALMAVKDDSENLTALLAQSRQLTDELHLEIESFYLFAKILLDHAAHAVFYYFGPERGMRLFRHSVLVKRLPAYAADKNLTIPDGFQQQIGSLEARISDYRDHNIAHDNSARTMYVTMFDNVGRKARLVQSRLQPVEQEANQQADSETPTDLIVLINQYVDSLVGLLEANRERTNIKLAADVGEKPPRRPARHGGPLGPS